MQSGCPHLVAEKLRGDTEFGMVDKSLNGSASALNGASRIRAAKSWRQRWAAAEVLMRN